MTTLPLSPVRQALTGAGSDARGLTDAAGPSVAWPAEDRL